MADLFPRVAAFSAQLTNSTAEAAYLIAQRADLTAQILYSTFHKSPRIRRQWSPRQSKRNFLKDARREEGCDVHGQEVVVHLRRAKTAPTPRAIFEG